MKNFAVSFMLLFAYVAVFPEESNQLSASDIIGTFRLDRIEQNWAISDAGRIEEDLKRIFELLEILEIGEDYYILGDYPKYETAFEVVRIEENMAVSRPWWKREEYVSAFYPFFLEYRRHFDSVITTHGFVSMIEVFDSDTIVIQQFNAWLLYKRVK